MINILICDDDQYMRRMLRKIVSENISITNVYDAANGIEALDIIQEHTINIALLDIDMPKLNGIETAKLISKISPSTRFVFITAHADYAIESFTVHPYDYLLKPVDEEILQNTLSELIGTIIDVPTPLKGMLSVKKNGINCFIPEQKIIYFEKVGKQTIVHTFCENYTIGKTLVELEKDLNLNFIRTHRAYIVNTGSILQMVDVGNRTYSIKFKDTTKIAYMSRYKLESFKNVIQTFNK